MRLLGIDYGDKRIGIAISDPLGSFALGVAVVGKGNTFDKDLAEINQVIKKFDGVNGIVVGLPKKMSGELGIQAEKVLRFVDYIKEKLRVPIYTWDERLSTKEAERALKDAGLNSRKIRKVVDKSAAANILQSYLDYKKHENNT
ncbi:MAG: putative holliday junction resolvase [Candidatus Saganbacteria bacterium]|uniref:Putative pre-16S rRNA nuclease n=1 Tax=Candidatus Saganbacteria bacterium TaxID=2575572 RepID=A0A833P0L0_UNCSA|nr:MAG: putative holliday junction resolvase [Candidatus Saganbacteria bacterium]